MDPLATGECSKRAGIGSSKDGDGGQVINFKRSRELKIG